MTDPVGENGNGLRGKSSSGDSDGETPDPLNALPASAVAVLCPASPPGLGATSSSSSPSSAARNSFCTSRMSSSSICGSVSPNENVVTLSGPRKSGRGAASNALARKAVADWVRVASTRLQSRSMDIPATLVERHGEVVSSNSHRSTPSPRPLTRDSLSKVLSVLTHAMAVSNPSTALASSWFDEQSMQTIRNRAARDEQLNRIQKHQKALHTDYWGQPNGRITGGVLHLAYLADESDQLDPPFPDLVRAEYERIDAALEVYVGATGHTVGGFLIYGQSGAGAWRR